MASISEGTVHRNNMMDMHNIQRPNIGCIYKFIKYMMFVTCIRIYLYCRYVWYLLSFYTMDIVQLKIICFAQVILCRILYRNGKRGLLLSNQDIMFYSILWMYFTEYVQMIWIRSLPCTISLLDKETSHLVALLNH